MQISCQMSKSCDIHRAVTLFKVPNKNFPTEFSKGNRLIEVHRNAVLPQFLTWCETRWESIVGLKVSGYKPGLLLPDRIRIPY